jgi:hypothetical protein
MDAKEPVDVLDITPHYQSWCKPRLLGHELSLSTTLQHLTDFLNNSVDLFQTYVDWIRKRIWYIEDWTS